jgi:hypothetical protein
MESRDNSSGPSITPILAGWFSSGMIESRDDDVVSIDGKVIDCLSVVGRLIEHEFQATKVFFTLEDGTDFIKFVVNKRVEEDLPYQLDGINLAIKNQYLKVVFVPQVYRNNITNVVNRVEAITNYNAITHHFLSTVYSVRFRSEGNIVNLKYEQHLKNQDLKQKSSSTNGNALHKPNGMNRSNGNHYTNDENLKNTILESIRELKRANNDRDFTFNQIKNQIGTSIEVNTLKRCLEMLQNNGLLFEEDGRFDLL